MRAKDVIAGLVTLLVVVAAAIGYLTWHMEGEVSLHGWIAFGLGVTLTIALLAGLLTLMYISHHRGYDDHAGRR